jgi:hypothetical protein
MSDMAVFVWLKRKTACQAGGLSQMQQHAQRCCTLPLPRTVDSSYSTRHTAQPHTLLLPKSNCRYDGYDMLFFKHTLKLSPPRLCVSDSAPMLRLERPAVRRSDADGELGPNDTLLPLPPTAFGVTAAVAAAAGAGDLLLLPLLLPPLPEPQTAAAAGAAASAAADAGTAGSGAE